MTVTIDTDVSLCSKASVMIGGQKIATFADGSTEATIANELYALIFEGALTAMPWTFATTQVDLTQLNATPLDTWQFAWQLPSDYLSAQSVTVDGCAIPYDIQGTRLVCDYDASTPVALLYTQKIAESQLPPYFKKALVFELAAAFAGALDRDEKFKEYSQKAGMAWAEARLKGSQQTTTQRFRPSKLVQVRLGASALLRARPQGAGYE